jgi:hypothetical protein
MNARAQWTAILVLCSLLTACAVTSQTRAPVDWQQWCQENDCAP